MLALSNFNRANDDYGLSHIEYVTNKLYPTLVQWVQIHTGVKVNVEKWSELKCRTKSTSLTEVE